MYSSKHKIIHFIITHKVFSNFMNPSVLHTVTHSINAKMYKLIILLTNFKCISHNGHSNTTCKYIAIVTSSLQKQIILWKVTQTKQTSVCWRCENDHAKCQIWWRDVSIAKLIDLSLNHVIFTWKRGECYAALITEIMKTNRKCKRSLLI